MGESGDFWGNFGEIFANTGMLRLLLCAGTTVIEAKSGYGLNVETELKMLRVLERAKRELGSFIDISITFCGAHAIPK